MATTSEKVTENRMRRHAARLGWTVHKLRVGDEDRWHVRNGPNWLTADGNPISDAKLKQMIERSAGSRSFVRRPRGRRAGQ